MPLVARNAWIDRIRGVSILLVLFHHYNIAYRLDGGPLASLFGWEAVRAVARNGNYGVTMFFVVSGFLITSHALARWGSLARIDARAFYGMRAARILPCLLLLLATVNLLALAGLPIFQNRPHGGEPLSFWVVNLAALGFWVNVLIAHAGWFNYPLGVLWSLGVEEVFYLAFPLLCLGLCRTRWLLAAWCALIVAGPLYRAAHQGDEAGYLYAYLASFDGIAIGCCTALLARRFAPLAGLARWLAAITIVAMAALYLHAPISQSNVWGMTGMALCTAVLLWCSARAAVSPRHGPLAWLGRQSYELYLFHLIVLGLMRSALPPATVSGEVRAMLLPVYLALSAGLAVLIARYFSEPLNRAIRQRLTQPPGVAAAART